MNFPSSTGMRISAMATAGLGALVAYLMLAQHTEVKRMREERAALARDNEALRAELSRKTSAAGAGAARAASTGTGGIGRVSADAEPVVGARDTAGAPAGVGGGEGTAEPAASVALAAPEMVPSPTGAAPQPRADGLALAGVHAAPDGSGMRATMSFTPTTTDPLGIVALVVRLPRDSQSRILDFAPVDNEGIGSVVKRVSDDGKFAVFQGTATDLKKLQVSLAVSAPVTADIRGTCGVGPYQLQIAPGGAKLQ